MNLPDIINSAFEAGGGLMAWYNCLTIYRVKRVSGYSFAAQAFFTMWGFWNMWYYPHLNQWASFVGGVVVVSANATYTLLMYAYRRK